MSRHRFFFAGLLALCGFTFLIAAGPRDDAWKEVDQAISSGKPQTAIEKLAPIIRAAMNEKKYAEAIKGIATKIALEAGIQGNRAEEKITRLEAEIANAPEEMKPTMEAILANWYWQYFQQNRWRFLNRTQTAAAPEADFTTWDLPRILNEIDRHFVASLAKAEPLQQIPISEYEDLLEKGNAPASYRPTLFDVLAHNALAFYVAGEQAASQPFDAFQLSAGSPIFSSAADFIGWQPETTDQSSSTLKAIRIYQQLLAFHQDDADQSALLDADLSRIIFGNNQAVGDEKRSRYQSALRRFADQHRDHEISSRALHHLAQSFYQEDDPVQAHQVASEGLRLHEDSVGGRRCFNLIQQIEAKSIRVATERVWNDPLPTIDVTYRNITKVHFRLVPFDFLEVIRSNRWQPEALDAEARQRLLSATPVRTWDADLPKTADYQERVESLPCPDDIAPGSYFLICSHNAEFSGEDNSISFTEVWRSDLAFVMRSHQGQGRIDGLVLDAKSGEPIAGATVRAWKEAGRSALAERKIGRTDKEGRFEIESGDRDSLIFLVSHRDQSLSSIQLRRSYRQADTRSRRQTIFFTDRAIYRPGQTIHFKGICVSIQQSEDSYQTLPNQALTVAFEDANGQVIEELSVRTNDYGSFSGSVTAPRDRVMGEMTLMVNDGPDGETSFAVEEYKRPKFRVEIDAPSEQAKLQNQVSMTGKATAYTGASINGAKVRWRVVREVIYPRWWFWRCWWLPPMQDTSQEIAHGNGVTDEAGRFEISFEAKPDSSAPPESEPVFRYSIHADVTDGTGETRSSTRVLSLGYAAFKASLTANDWLTSSKPVEIKISTQTLDGEPLGVNGRLQVYELKQPDQVARSPLPPRYDPFLIKESKPADPANPNAWPLGEVVHQTDFATDATGKQTVSAKLAQGVYRAKLVSSDAFGKEVTAELPITVIDPEADHLSIKVPNLFKSVNDTLEPGDEYIAVVGSGYETARIFVEVVHRGRVLQRYWTKPGTTQTTIRQPVNEKMRGGFHVRTVMVRENRAYTESRFVDVPWTNKNLTIRWEHFVSKLEPASQEVWTAIISGPDAERAVAEMVATLYDASLDAFRPHQWTTFARMFRRDNASVHLTFENELKYLQHLLHTWQVVQRDESLSYPHLPFDLGGSRRMRAMRGLEMAFDGAAEAEGMQMSMGGMGGGMMGGAMAADAFGELAKGSPASERQQGAPGDSGQAPPDLSGVSARKNLNETAFFFPHLMSNQNGTIELRFTMPEALTEWNFLGFAHDKQLRSGLLTGSTVTAKELMVEPNPPRFLREGDEVEFTVKVSNQSPTRQSGSVRLSFSDARTGDPIDALIGNELTDQPFEIAAGSSLALSWKLSIPDGLGFMIYKAVGSTGRLSDGQEGMLPVLSRRVLVTESLPLPIRGKQSKAYRFDKLLTSGQSNSLQHQSLTVQMVSNPSWYAVMALPYLMEYPYECSEQVFNRLYANALARHVAQSDPKIRRTFDQWRATPALDSPLEKNQDLKSVMLEETPWLRQAKDESQSRRNLGILFDENRLNDEISRAMYQLTQMQLDDGAWPWFPGGSGNDYITLYVTTGFGRLRHLGVKVDVAPAVESLARLDSWADNLYKEIAPKDRDLNHLGSTMALYLYGRSFFLNDQPIAAEHRDAWEFWLSQASKHWLDLASRQSQAHVAIALKRADHADMAKQITDSLKERSVNEEELGMYWRDLELSWWWYRAPIETQAMMIEAFDEVADDQQAVEDCKVWLLKQKQTQDWKTTKATADAVYALLLRGTNLLASDALVQVRVAGEPLAADDVEAGTGYFEHRWTAKEIQPSFGQIELNKTDEGVAWGSVHWQYLEDMAKVTPHTSTPLTLTKQLFVKKLSPTGPVLDPVDGPVEVGDELVVRLVLRTDRDMEYVHLKDYRGSGTEPVNVLSQYKYQDGLAYYESTRDAASHFFIDYLPKGTYVFEYATRVQLRGHYQTGFATIQCMYAPEFNSHSESLPISAQ